MDNATMLALMRRMGGGGGSGSSVQSDWSQNDETAKDYVKNRTHWVEDGGIAFTDANETQTFTITTDDAGYAEIEDASKLLFADNKDYALYLNDEFYSGKSVDYTGHINGRYPPVDAQHDAIYDGCYVEFVKPDGDSGVCILSMRSAGYSIYHEFHNFPANSEITIEIGEGGSVKVYHPLAPELGGMPALASDGSDAGKFVKANEDGTGYELDSIGGECDWNTMKNKPFGIEIAKTTIFSGDVDMPLVMTDPTYVAGGKVEVNLATVPEEVTVTAGGVSTVINSENQRFAYSGRNIALHLYADKVTFDCESFEGGFTIEDITIEAVTETVRPIDPKLIVLTSPNGTKYNLTVADDGTLSAVAAE